MSGEMPAVEPDSVPAIVVEKEPAANLKPSVPAVIEEPFKSAEPTASQLNGDHPSEPRIKITEEERATTERDKMSLASVFDRLVESNLELNISIKAAMARWTSFQNLAGRGLRISSLALGTQVVLTLIMAYVAFKMSK